MLTVNAVNACVGKHAHLFLAATAKKLPRGHVRLVPASATRAQLCRRRIGANLAKLPNLVFVRLMRVKTKRHTNYPCDVYKIM